MRDKMDRMTGNVNDETKGKWKDTYVFSLTKDGCQTKWQAQTFNERDV